jgi:hypothetical protein
MPDLVLPQKKSPLKTLAQSVAEIPLFWYLTSSRWFFNFLKNIFSVGENRSPFRNLSLVGRWLGTLLLLALFLVWLAFPPVCLYQSLRNPSYLIFLISAAVGVLIWRSRQPRRRIAEVTNQPVVNVEDIATKKVRQAAQLDSVKFLTTAHHFSRLENLLRRLEAETPLKVSGASLQVFRAQKVWEIAFEEAVKTGAQYLQLEHLFFGVLGFEEMKEITEQLGLKIEDVHEVIKWMQKQENWSRSPAPPTPSVSGLEQTLEALEYRAFELEKERQVTISYPAVATAIELAAKNFPDQPLPDRARELLEAAVSRVVRAGGNFVGSADVAKLVSGN